MPRAAAAPPTNALSTSRLHGGEEGVEIRDPLSDEAGRLRDPLRDARHGSRQPLRLLLGAPGDRFQTAGGGPQALEPRVLPDPVACLLEGSDGSLHLGEDEAKEDDGREEGRRDECGRDDEDQVIDVPGDGHRVRCRGPLQDQQRGHGWMSRGVAAKTFRPLRRVVAPGAPR